MNQWLNTYACTCGVCISHLPASHTFNISHLHPPHISTYTHSVHFMDALCTSHLGGGKARGWGRAHEVKQSCESSEVTFTELSSNDKGEHIDDAHAHDLTCMTNGVYTNMHMYMCTCILACIASSSNLSIGKQHSSMCTALTNTCTCIAPLVSLHVHM